jgi:hypothetical protein
VCLGSVCSGGWLVAGRAGGVWCCVVCWVGVLSVCCWPGVDLLPYFITAVVSLPVSLV